MTVDHARKLSVGEQLLTLGWQQGTVFAAPTLAVVHYKASEDGLPTLSSRLPSNRERFVVISQDCDIKSDKEPNIEALLCTVKKETFIRRLLDAKSARFFAVDEVRRLVAQATYRVSVQKELLLPLELEPWPSSPERRSRFITWLGRRYDRPALPDDIVEHLQRPLERALARIKDEQPEPMMLFSGAVHEVRVSPPWTAEPPYHMQLVVLIRSHELSAEEADALTSVTDEMQTEVDSGYILLDAPRFVTEDEISLREYRATSPIFLEYLTYQGDEVQGVEPLRAA